MAILIDKSKKVIIQGITGREGSLRTKLMVDYGTNVVAGVTPGRKGDLTHGIPVYDSVEEAIEEQGNIDISVVFVPAPFVKGAAIESVVAGVKLVVLVPDRVPLYDAVEIAEYSEEYGARFIGPNTLGLISPGMGVLGMIGGQVKSAKQWFLPGNMGVTSRSGGMTSAISYYLSKAGVGQSTVVHVGGDAVIGMRHADIISEFEKDEATKAVVMFGEIGTSQEEEVAQKIKDKKITKPVIAYISGAAAQSGTRFSHAGAIIEGNKGSYASKVETLKESGAIVVDVFENIFKVAQDVLSQ